ncbi:MAG TPA: EamA family transporter, partial [Bacteroidia bacterium]|nr:EamA family transporter [Bacteroidia bacterium]
MIFLLLSIVFNSMLFLILKYFEIFRVNTLQAITVNYVTAFGMGVLTSTGTNSLQTVFHAGWAWVAVVMGSFFILVFLLIARTAQEIGVSVATVANKLSVVIPVALAVLFYHNSLGWTKITGILIAVTAVFLTSKKERDPAIAVTFKAKAFVLPAVVFLGSGIIDSLVNYAQEKLVPETDSSLFLACGFAVPACIGLVLVLFKVLFRKEGFQLKSITGGIILGVPNFISIWCLMKALNSHYAESSVIYPLNNMGIVILCAGSSFVLFREKFSFRNIAGIG